MKKTVLFLASCFLLFTTSCKNNKPTKYKTADEILEMASNAPGINAGNENYVIETPKDWTTRDTLIKKIKFHFLSPPRNEATKGINVNIANESMMDVPFDKYVELTLESMESVTPTFKLMEQGSFDNAGTKTAWMRYMATLNNFNLEGILYIIPNNGIAYVMTATTPEGKMDTYRSTFDRIARSFKFKGQQ